MSNYTNENLISIPSASVPAGTLAMKVGDNVFTAGNVIISTTDYYKCASVNTANQTWTGYKAVFDAVTGTYSFEATVTSGLTYSVVTPVVGRAYADEALIEAKLYEGIPLNGLDFYLPLESNMNEVIHNYAVNTSYDYDNEFGITSDSTGGFLRCNKQYDGTGRIYWPGTENQYAYGTNDFAVSFWLRAPNWDNYGNQIVLNKKADDSDTGIVIRRIYQDDDLGCRLAYTNDLGTTAVVSNQNWVHWCIVRENGVGYWYRNGVSNATGTMTGSFTSTEPFNIGYHGQPGWSSTAKFDLKAVRIYNRALTLAEIAALAAEFTTAQE